MRLFVSGSAPLLAETHERWREHTGHAILERYGMTETNMITSNPYDGERRAGTVGFPLPGVALRIAEPESGAAVAARRDRRHRGQGAECLQGLLADAGEDRGRNSAPTASSSPAISAAIDERGYVQIVGRAKDLIISGGFNVYPKEVESEIDALDGVVESAVIGLPHPDFGEGVTAVVVRAPGRGLNEVGDPRGARRAARASSSRPSGCSSSRSCRATRWARCRRRRCVRTTRAPFRADRAPARPQANLATDAARA